MRTNRMLYAPGISRGDPASDKKAGFVPFAQIPQPAAYGLMAVFHFSLVERLGELGLACEREHDELQGGWYHIMGIALPSGRFAFVQEFDHHPGDVDLHLPVWRDMHLHREDFFSAKNLLGVPDERITLCDGPFLWR